MNWDDLDRGQKVFCCFMVTIASPFFIYESFQKGQPQARWKRRFQRAVKPIKQYKDVQMPVSYRPTLRRALTLPLPEKKSLMTLRRVGKTEIQAESGFFKLPYEIREMIYLQFLVLPKLHLVRVKGKMIGTKCKGEDLKGPYEHGHVDGTPTQFGDICCPRIKEGDSIMALFCTCRRIYTDLIPLIYKKTTFYLNQQTLSFLPRKLPPARLSQLQHLRVYTSTCAFESDLKGWNRACTVFHKMTGLKSLFISFGTVPHRTCVTDGTSFVRPLMALRVPDFVLQLPTGVAIFGLEFEKIEWWVENNAKIHWDWEGIGATLATLPFRVLWEDSWRGVKFWATPPPDRNADAFEQWDRDMREICDTDLLPASNSRGDCV
ncbi:hypothetical protein BDV19DRAFT_374688 [Aspergillus venezuelensis]